MSMAQELDYTTLKWVKEEIDESLKQTRQALENYVENPDDIAQIRFCTTYLHQVYGTLQMVEIYGAALLAEEMEHLTEALSQGKIKQKDNAYDVLMRAILQLPAYLEHIEQGHNDQPVILLPLLNDLRSARGDHLLSDNAFFSPDLKVKPPEVLNDRKDKIDLKSYAKKLRTVFQAALVGIYRNQDIKGNLKKLAAIVKEFHIHSDTEDAIRFWWVASGVLEAQLEDGLEVSNPIKQTLGQLDKNIKNVISDGSQAFENNPSSDLLKTLLYYVATANSSGLRVQQIKSAFKLGELVPAGGTINEAFDSLKGSSTDLLQSVSSVIKEDLLQVKDSLDLYVRNKNSPVAELKPLCEQLDRISDTLVMLGFGDLRKIIQEQITCINEFIASDTQPTEINLMEIASALLYIESSLDGIDALSAKELGNELSGLSNTQGKTLLPYSEQRQLTKLVIGQALEVLLKVKESFNTYANDTTELSIINKTPEYLFQVKGVLAVLSLNYAATILQAAIKYIKTDLIVAQKQPDQSHLDAIADVISSIEYYLEAVAENRSNSDTLLENAAQRVSELGYPVAPHTPAHPSVDIDLSAMVNHAPAQTAVETVNIDIAEQPTETIDLGPNFNFDTNIERTIRFEPTTESAALAKKLAVEPDLELELELDELEPDVTEAPLEEPQLGEKIVAPSTSATAAQAVNVDLDDNIDEEILEIFIEEADEVFVVMKEKLAAWEANQEDQESLSILRRSYHTIKGSGRLAGAVVLGEFAWSMENLLNHVIDKKIETKPAMFALLQDAESVLNELINQLKNASGISPDIQPYINRANDLISGIESKVAPVVPVAVKTEQIKTKTEEYASAPEPATQDILLSDIFKRETNNHISNIRTYVQEYDHAHDNFVNDTLMRALHTLHGSARMAEVNSVAGLSEALDRYFRTLHDKKMAVDNSALEILKESADVIDDAVKNELEESQIADTLDNLKKQILELHTRTHAVKAVTQDSHQKISADAGELKSIFLDESKEIIKDIEKLLIRWSYAQDDIATMKNLQQVFHRLQSGAQAANIASIANMGQRLENILKSYIQTQKPITSELLKFYQKAFDWLTSNVANLRSDLEVTQDSTLSASVEKFFVADGDEIDALVLQNETIEIDLSTDDPMTLQLLQLTQSHDHDDELLHIFHDEAKDILSSNEKELDLWQQDINNFEPIAEIQRSLHTLKGGARMAEITAISDLAHALETLLEAIIDGQVTAHVEIHHLVQTCHDWLTLALEKVRNKVILEPATNLIAQIKGVIDRGEPAPVEYLEPIEMAPAPEVYNLEMVPEDVDSAAISITQFDEQQSSAEIPSTELEYDAELIEIFLEEAAEIQESSEQFIHKWRDDLDNRDTIAELQRALHTLKGGARMANISTIGDMSHAIESLLEAVNEDRLQPTEQFPIVVQACHDWLANAIDNVKQNRSVAPGVELLQQLEDLLAGKILSHPGKVSAIAQTLEPATQADESAQVVELAELIELPAIDDDKAQADADIAEIRARIASPRVPNELIRVKAELIDNLVNYAGETNIYNSRIGQQFNAWQFNLTELHSTVQRLHDQLRKFEIETEAQIMYRHSSVDALAGDIDDTFDPLEMDRFSNMQQLSRGMVESLGDLTSIEDLLQNITGEASVLLLQQSRVNTDLQEGLMNTRMTPFSSILARLQRIVRQTCQETGKEANLNVVGAEGEMDRTQLNRIVPALEHILRNAIDHGVESPQERINAGKDSTGNIEIRLERESSEVVIHIKDDGAGINLDRIREKAMQKGLLGEHSIINDSEIIEFILQSGFSTADQVTQISGRGIGMDVVNTEIKQLNGTLHINSKLNEGTSFVVRLPLTVLVNQALLVDVSEIKYAIQLTNIEHVIRVSNEELNKLISTEQEFFEYAGNQYQYLNLGYILHNNKPKTVAGKMKSPLLLGRSGGHRVAMHIDQLLGRQEIVIKSVGPQLSQINYISGATILPDGEVALILDISTLIRRNIALQQMDEAQLVAATQVVEANAKAPTVMIVDDSITVRKVTERLLKRHNFETITAKDGVDALTVLFEQIPDLMLLDVEMPRMDGYELATAMRNDDKLKHIPIIMITSRTGEKHRDRAFEIGVDNYMGKPYQESELLENIQKLLNKS